MIRRLHQQARWPIGGIHDSEVHLLDAGHFALETHHGEIATLMRDFLGRRRPV